MEHLMRDFNDALEELRTLKYSLLKDKLVSGAQSEQASRQAQL